MATIIFDMDGTIADSFDYVASFLAVKARQEPTDELKDSLRGLSMSAMARRLGFHWWDAPGLFISGRRGMGKVMGAIRTFEGIFDVIHKLHAEGHELFIVSTNTKDNVKTFIEHQRMDKYFIDIYGGVGVFSKSSALRRLLKNNQLPIDGAVYVGDESRDIEAARAIGLKAVAVSWGFASRARLEALKPLAIADNPEQLLAVLENL